MISALLFVATRHRTHAFGRLSLLAGAIALLAVSDSTFWYLSTVKNFDRVNPSDAGWFAGFLLLGFGAVATRDRPTPDDAIEPGTGHGASVPPQPGCGGRS